MASLNITSNSTWEDPRCTALALGFSNMSHLTAVLILSFSQAIVAMMTGMLYAQWSEVNNKRAKKRSPSNSATGTTSTTTKTSASSSLKVPKPSQIPHTKAPVIRKSTESNADPPPEYTSFESDRPDSSIPLLTTSSSSSSSSPEPRPEPAPETRAFVDATLLLAFHLALVVICGFSISRVLYCPSEQFPTGVRPEPQFWVWAVYALHVVVLGIRVIFWLDRFGDLYPEKRRPKWTRPSKSWMVVWLPLIGSYRLLIGYVEGLRGRLGEERIQETNAGKKWGKQGGYQKILGKENGDEGLGEELGEIGGGKRDRRRDGYQKVPDEEMD